MEKQNQKIEQQNGEEQKNEAPVQQQNENAAEQAETTTKEKSGFGRWLKRHWKGVVAGLTGTGAIVGSAVVAYKKGKAAGCNMQPYQEQEDYSLNPNE